MGDGAVRTSVMKLAVSFSAIAALMGQPFLGQSRVADPAPFHSTRAPVPSPDCKARVGYDRNMVLPGYLLPTSEGPRTCIPFTTAYYHPPFMRRFDPDPRLHTLRQQKALLNWRAFCCA